MGTLQWHCLSGQGRLPQENSPCTGAWSNRCLALHKHSACLTEFSCIMDSSVSMNNPEQYCKYFFFPGDFFIECVQISLWKLGPLQKHMKNRFDCLDLTQLSSEEAHTQATTAVFNEVDTWRTRTIYSRWSNTLIACQFNSCTAPSTAP